MKFDLFDAMKMAEHYLGESVELLIRRVANTYSIRITKWKNNKAYCFEYEIDPSLVNTDDDVSAEILGAQFKRALMDVATRVANS